MNYIVAAFYLFTELDDLKALQAKLLRTCQELGICGTILLAPEGINATVAGSRQAIDALLAWLKADPRMVALTHKESATDQPPFYRMKVRLKKEIVTLKAPEANPAKQVGTYVAPQAWNDLIAEPDVIVLDTRNQYEVEIGTFQGAKDPHTRSFGDFPDYVKTHLDPQKHPKVAMFCTGGIRCEKASAYMLAHGFKEIYHLEGGILNYLEKVPAEQSLWQGECFVFDQRVTVTHGLAPGSYQLCYCCRAPLSATDRTSPDYLPGIQCPHCIDSTAPEVKMRKAERQKQVELAAQRQESHIGWHSGEQNN
jgi:UPF0176 protein